MDNLTACYTCHFDAETIAFIFNQLASQNFALLISNFLSIPPPNIPSHREVFDKQTKDGQTSINA